MSKGRTIQLSYSESAEQLIETFTLVDRKIQDANDGDIEAATWLVQEFCSTFRRSPSSHPRRAAGAVPTYFEDRILDYLVGCFDTLFDDKGRKIKGAIPGQALNLTSIGKRGPKAKRSVTSRDFSLGIMVAQQYMIEKANPDQSGASGSNLEKAISKVAQDEGHSHEIVREGYKQYRSRMRFLKSATN